MANTRTRDRLVQIICFSIIPMILATDAYAQGNPMEAAVTHAGIGVGTTFTSPSDGDSSEGVAVVFRWHRFRSGWGPTFAFDWHSNDFNQTLGSGVAPLGSLNMRVLLAGFGYTRRVGRFSASASAKGGYSFNDFSVDSNARPAFANAGNPLLGVSVDNGWAVKPDVAVWYDFGRHVGVGVTAGYLFSRPDRTLRTATGTVEQEMRADAFELTTGLVFGVWKKR
jgi:hypothetical protein